MNASVWLLLLGPYSGMILQVEVLAMGPLSQGSGLREEDRYSALVLAVMRVKGSPTPPTPIVRCP